MSRSNDSGEDAPEITGEELMLYADGMLAAKDRKRIDAALARDADVVCRLAAFTRTQSSGIAPPFVNVLEAPIPDSVLSAARRLDAALGRTGLQAKPAEKPGLIDRIMDALRRSLPSGPGAMGVALALAAVTGIILAGPGFKPPASDGFSTALETAASRTRIVFKGDDGERSVTPMLSFRDKANRFCRLYELTRAGKSTLSGVACRDEGTWRTVFESDTGALPSPGRITPAGADVDLNRRLEEMRSGDALGPEQEIALIRKGWKQ